VNGKEKREMSNEQESEARVEKKLTMSHAIKMVIDQLDGPISEEEMARRVFEIFPTTAKTARSSLKNNIRYDHDGQTLIRISKDKIIPMRLFMPGVRFRIPVNARLAHACILTLDMFDPFYFRDRLGKTSLTFEDEKGEILSVSMKSIMVSAPRELAHFLGSHKGEGYDLQDWAEKHKIQKGDSILVTIKNWDRNIFAVEHEPAGKRRRLDIEAANHEFADNLFNLLEGMYVDKPLAFQIIPKVYASLSNPYGYPGDPWMEVIEMDGRMNCDGFMITYAEDLSLFERMTVRESGKNLPYIHDKYTREQANQVYRFRAESGDSKGIWREVEIKGSQRLVDLDRILRMAFQWDTSDHLGGFWKLIPRGTSKRVREIEIGDVNPLGGGSAADLHVGGLDFKPGDRLKYVYDFGDWFEHFLTLKEISTAVEGVKYPRIASQNKPRYKYCQACTDDGKKTIATIICLDCSNRKKEDVLVCKDCYRRQHQNHDYEVIVY
jgi:hypothetical protein